MKKFSFVTALLLTLIFLSSGCATLFTGTKDTIYFDSDPRGATVYLDGIELCTTPCSYRIKRSLLEKDFEVQLDGYETRIVTLDSEFNIISILNLGLLPGWLIDAATGAIMRYDRKSYHISLKKISKLAESKPSEIHIDTRNKTVALHVIQQE